MSGAERGGAKPVFVDPSGRRARVLQRVFWTVGALMAAYVGLVVISLVGPPGLSRLTVPGLGPVLPGPGAAPLGDGSGGRQRPGQVLAPTPSPGRTPPPGSASAAPGVTPSSPTALPSPSASRPATAGPTTSPAPAATPATGPPSARPTPSRSLPPGQASGGPTPRSSRTPARPTRSPR